MRSNRGYSTGGFGILVGLGVVACVVIFVVMFIAGQKQQDRTITVCGKESVSTGSDGGHEYRIYAADDTYTMGDNILGGVRFNTANEYGKIKENTTYDVRIKGLRIGFMSMFPNILKATVAKEQHPELCNA